MTNPTKEQLELLANWPEVLKTRFVISAHAQDRAIALQDLIKAHDMDDLIRLVETVRLIQEAKTKMECLARFKAEHTKHCSRLSNEEDLFQIIDKKL